MIEQILESLGIDSSESKIYLALLNLGTNQAGGLAKKIGVPRSSLYGSLKRLIESGLVS